MQKCLVKFGVFAPRFFVVVGLGMGLAVALTFVLAMAVGKWDYVVRSAGAVLLHKDLPPFGLVLTSVRENPYVPQTAQSSRFFDID